MTLRARQRRWLASSSAALSLLAGAPKAFAQATPLPDGIAIGAWTFRPSLEVRVRGEYRRHPIDLGGATYLSSAVLYDDFETPLPAAYTTAPVENDYFVAERARLALSVDRGPVTATFGLQDARALGNTTLVGSGVLAPFEAYVDLHTRTGRKVFFRLGRQRITWGDGRLIGENDWSRTGRSLDAARLGFQVGDFDIETMAVLLAAPAFVTRIGGGAAGASATASASGPLAAGTGGLGGLGGLGTLGGSGGSGAQLYGIDATWHALPLLQVELTGLARITRDPHPSSLTPSDTFVIDGRIFGDRRGFRYAVEGAYQLGRVASYGVNRDHRAFGLAAKAALETALPWHLTFGAEGAYASGDDGNTTGTLTRFDPIFPDEHTTLGPMGLFAWSNVIEVGGTVTARPHEIVALSAGYRYAALASPNGRWITAALTPVGAVDPASPASPASPDLDPSSRSLGHEIDAAISVTPWKAIGFEGGYGLFLFGDRAREILRQADRPATLQHWAYVQAVVRAP